MRIAVLVGLIIVSSLLACGDESSSPEPPSDHDTGDTWDLDVGDATPDVDDEVVRDTQDEDSAEEDEGVADTAPDQENDVVEPAECPCE